ncbi:FAD-binding domain-containing protein [Xylariaceae sp. FL0016]|nr:FAD-binding domain-containing protein [Xylariaceae sp. FL0016]
MALNGATDQLKKLIAEEPVFLPGTEAYRVSRENYLSARESDRTPAGIFQPFAIRGAGQRPLEACANIHDGITVDLSRLRGINLNPDTNTVFVAAGEHWGAVYGKVQAAGLGVNGSRSGKGGIGGLGRPVLLLLTPLKGGGNNFGIVTRFDLRTFPQKPFWSGVVFCGEGDLAGQIQALVEEIRRPDASREIHIMVSLGEDAATGNIKVPPMLRPFVDVLQPIEGLNSFKIVTLAEGATEQAAMASERVRCAYVNCTVCTDSEALQSAARIHSQAIELLKSIEGITFSSTLQPYPVSLLSKTAELGGNVLGLDAGKPLVSVLLLTYWKRAQDDEPVIAVLQDALEKIKKDAAGRGQLVPYTYLNYASRFQDPLMNKKFLQEVSRKYNPEGVFQGQVPCGFKLFT